MREIRCLWASGARNFGDCLTPWILDKYGCKAVLDWGSGGRLLLAGTTNTLSKPGDVCIGAGSWFPCGWFGKGVEVLAARGPLGAPEAPFHADAALFLRQRVKWVGGGGPLALRSLMTADKAPFDGIRSLPLSTPVDVVLEAIINADAVVSDALHGYAAAAALGIPAARLSNHIDMLPRNSFRWEDFASGMDMGAVPAWDSVERALGHLSQYPAGMLDEKASRLDEALMSYIDGL
jgi:hypothetical protein